MTPNFNAFFNLHAQMGDVIDAIESAYRGDKERARLKILELEATVHALNGQLAAVTAKLREYEG